MAHIDIDLDKTEQQILKDFDKGTLKSISDFKREKGRYQDYAKTMLSKTKNINIRVSESDLLKIKAQALRKGVPYQTMLTSLIHQYSTGQIQHQILF